MLPIAVSTAYFTKTTDTLDPARSKIRCILLAEDEPIVRDTISRMLKHLDIKVIEANDAMQAIKLWHAHRDEIDLVLTDLVMPSDKNGLDLAKLVATA